jgi:hypothetical protein
MRTYRFVHVPCGATAETPDYPDDHAPEPDRHGNHRTPLTCTACGERGEYISGGPAKTGATGGFKKNRNVEWAVPLD